MKNKCLIKSYKLGDLNIESRFYNVLNEGYYFTTLPNGLKIYYIEKKDFKNFECSISVKYGALDNHFKINGKTYDMPLGIAHFLEHMKFKSADNTDIMDKFDELSLSLNAYTSQKETCYYYNGSKNFYCGLELLVDFLFKPYFTDEEVSKESEVILREYYEGYNPDSVLDRELEEALIKENEHKQEIVGTPTSIKKITKDDLYFCYNTFYQASNMTMYVIGDLNQDELFNKTKELFSNYNSLKNEIEYINVIEDSIVNNHYKEIKWGVNIPKVALGIKLDFIPYSEFENSYKNNFYVFSLLSYHFEEKGKFFKKLEKSKLLESKLYFDYINEDGVSYIYFEFRSFKYEEVIDKILKEIRSFNNPILSKNDFNVRVRYKKASFFWGMNDISNIISKFRFYDQQYYNYFELPNVIDSFNYSECLEFNKKLFSKEFDDNNISIIVMK